MTRNVNRIEMRLLLIVGSVLAAIACGAWSAAPASAAPNFAITTTKTPVADFHIGDKGVLYEVVARNTGDAVAAGVPATLEVIVPPGVRPSVNTTDASNVYGSGFSTCTIVGRRVRCTDNAAIANNQVISIRVALAVDDAAVDGSKVAILVTGGGLPAPVSTQDPLSILPRLPFGANNFVATTFDEHGDPDSETLAGGHPFAANASFGLNYFINARQVRQPVETVKDIITDLPAGFVGNPKAIPTCPISGLIGGNCPVESQVGTIAVDLTDNFPIPPTQFYGLYNMVADRGNVAQFGAAVGQFGLVHLVASVRSDDDFGVRITASDIPASPVPQTIAVSLWGTPADPRHDGQRMTCNFGFCSPGASTTAPIVPFLSNLHQCLPDVPVTKMAMNPWVRPNEFSLYEASAAPVVGCDTLTFDPTVSIQPSTAQPDAPTGLDVDMAFPTEENPEGQVPPPLKKAVVTLPEGLTINPAAAGGLEACTDEQLNLKSLAPMTCPNAAKVGTASAKSPVLEETLTGGVYIRSQNSMDPESGQMFRLALVLENEERGLSIRLPGEVRVNKDTGRIEATFDNNPQLPVESIELAFKDGPRAPLATPTTCGEKTIATALDSWGGPGKEAQSEVTVECAAGLGAFGPAFSAGTTTPKAGEHTSFALKLDKPDGQSDLDGISLSMPEGLLASLKGNIGTRIGTARVGAGPGPRPFWLDGPVVLEGPYGDAPFSLRVTVPAVAGPFNLGDVVVRQKIYVDPQDAHVTVVSDPLPTIVKGVPVRLQNLRVDIDKPGFMINPTSCAEKTIGATLSAATEQTASASTRFQMGQCAALPFEPKLAMALTGRRQVTTGKHPGVRAKVTQTGVGEAGIEKAVVRLPKSLALDPENAQALCEFEDGTKPDLEKHCPKGSIVGRARAKTPLLERDLVGNVYFVKNIRKDAKTGNEIRTLPMIVVALRGEIAINLKGESSTTKAGKLVNTFANVPDAPITKFNLNIKGGKNGILAVTRTRKAKINLCSGRHVAEADMDGQNGRRHDSDIRMKTPCTKKQVKKAKRAAKKAAARS